MDDDALALYALGEDVLEPEQRLHLQDCAQCARTVAGLARVVNGARADEREAALVPPRPEVWTRIHSELGLTTPPDALQPDDAPVRRIGGDATETPAGADRDGGTTGGRRSFWMPALVAAGTALVLGIAGGVLWERRDLQPAEATVASAALSPVRADSPGETGQAVVQQTGDGRQQLVVSIDSPAPGDGYREVWLLTSDASGLISLGVLQGGEGRFTIPDGLDLTDFAVVDVSEEPFDGDPAHSGDSLVRGTLGT
ncbi:anti-sigma factor [Myceligenerans xiligouense]|uniref:anti-sigma factor n=1 Tax=Myceligenerans xiligouense TaxID=253184 RepID=UPI001FE9A544|nr:anti-sigma factor [Myceligenerans xiligouense]